MWRRPRGQFNSDVSRRFGGQLCNYPREVGTSTTPLNKPKKKVSQNESSSSVICQTTGPKPLPKRFLHIVRSRASSFNWQYPLLSLRSSSSFLRLLPRLLFTSICPFIFPSITYCRRQFLRKIWPNQLAFRFLISCMIFLCSLALSNTSSFLTWSVQLIFSILLQHHISKLSGRLYYNTNLKYNPELPL